MFDILTYEKGASVVRMLEQYLGADRFRAGIRRYMARHQFGNTETSDLWDALEEETGEPVRRIAETWIFQGGFPEVTVSSPDGAGLRFSQQRFGYGGAGGNGNGSGSGSSDGSGDGGGSTEARWAVPVVVEHGDGAGSTVARVLLDGPTADLAVSGPLGWAKANAGAHGFYRVRYAPDLLAALLDRLGELTPLERYVLVDDAWAAVLAGSMSGSAFLDMVDGFAGETDLSVWERIVGGLSQLERLVEGDARRRLHERVGALIGPARDRLGDAAADGEDDRTRTLRGTLLQAAAVLADNPAAQARCRDLLDAFLADPASVDPSLSSAALAASTTLGDVALHERLVERFGAAENPQDRERILRSLARFRDPDALARTLELSLSGSVRTQDAPYLLGETLANRDNGAAAWAFVSGRWDEVNERFPDNSIPRLIGGIRSLRDRGLAGEVAAFLDEHPIPQGALQVRQHIERMWVTVALAEREAGRL
jgi:puromycin-sensitive aminopeptidase